MRTYHIQVLPVHSGCTVEQVLRRGLGLSKTQLKRAKFYEEGILLDGIRVNSNRRVLSGQQITVHVPEREQSQVIPTPGPVCIRFEDQWFTVVEKPAGIAVHPGRGHYGDTLGNYLTWHYQQQGTSLVLRLVNRLDIGTSGLLILAKSAESHAKLQRLLHTEACQRHYLALCCGEPPQHAGRINAPIAPQPGALNAYQVSPSGLPAETRYRVLERRGRYCLVWLTLCTGRTHQIRVHLASLGCPLVGDSCYGGDRALRWPALHSCCIQLRHPFTGVRHQMVSPLPEKLARFWRKQR